MATDRYICIHGHFYQPPRENPWLERIDVQESAHPFHDWNERIDRECYAPNATAHILDERGRIARIVCNYASISFNFGPTLSSWLETHDLQVYRAIQEADRRSAARFGGHGSAIAQAWGHAILPLCNARDKRTQVLWGVRDFEHRFGRSPEGMWLPETAVDTETLEMLAECGLRFTILSPHQALAVRRAGARSWIGVKDGAIDTRRAYRCRLPSGREIALFFYDGGVSQAVAFERLLARGDRFTARLLGAFDAADDGAQLVHIATDGETYGHHHKFGDMALAWATDAIAARDDVRLTNYGEFLERHPPRDEVRIRERSAWSCAHGVGRWSADCGCCIGTNSDWNQGWREPLRAALDLLRDACAERFERDTRGVLVDPWAARDDYIALLLDDTPQRRREFLGRHAGVDLDAAAPRRLWNLLELQRQALLMYTSCGWFFDDLAGIETIQVLRYAARALELHEDLFDEAPGDRLRDRFLDALAAARSNRPGCGDGRRLFETQAASAAAALPRIAASLATRLLFDDDPQAADLPALDIEVREVTRNARGAQRLVTGRIALNRRATGESADMTVAAVYAGSHDLIVGVRPVRDAASEQALIEDVRTAFGHGADQASCVDALREHFADGTWSLGSLLADERQFALARILESTLGELEAVFRQLLENHAQLRRSVAGLGSAQPLELRLPAELVLNKDIRRALDADVEHLDTAGIRGLLERAREEGLSLDGTSLGFAASDALTRAVRRVTAAPGNTRLIEQVAAFAVLVVELPFGVDLRESQNALWQLRGENVPATAETPAAQALDALAEALGLRLAGPDA